MFVCLRRNAGAFNWGMYQVTTRDFARLGMIPFAPSFDVPINQRCRARIFSIARSFSTGEVRLKREAATPPEPISVVAQADGCFRLWAALVATTADLGADVFIRAV